jgi:uncharacterized membrane protein
MDTCPRCGASRSADLAWCGQCFLRWEPDEPAEPADEVVLVTARSTPEQDLILPWWTRALMTTGVLAGGVALIVMLGPWWDLGRPVWALGAVLLTIYAALGGVLVARLWSPETFTHREEHIVVLDRRVMQDVEERQRGLVVHDEPSR